MATSLDNVRAAEIALEDYYSSIASIIGNGGDFVQGTIFSRGRGLGSIIKAAMKLAAPLAKKVGRVLKPVAKKVGRYALKTGAETVADIAVDVLSGDSVKDAFNNNAAALVENSKYDAIQKIRSLKRKRPNTSKAKKSPKNRNHQIYGRYGKL